MPAIDYTRLKPSQIHLIQSPPFFCKNDDGEFILYKEAEERIKNKRLNNGNYPDLFIRTADKDNALSELSEKLNFNLAQRIAEKGLKEVKTALCRIIDEMLTPSQEKLITTMPETIEILLDGYNKNHKTLEYITRISVNSGLIIEHTVNVTALALQYCFFHNLGEDKIKQLAVCALLHDVGTTQIDRQILEATGRLTEKQFKTFQGHPVKGHDLIIIESDFDISVATVALEHHERIDGSGYPNGISQITEESQLIGLIDCFEPLTYRDKDFRKAKKPFDSLSIIKEETKQGKFGRRLFKDFISCLIR